MNYLDENEFNELFYRALKEEGLGIPTTMEEVKAAESKFDEASFEKLPERLEDAAKILRERKKFVLKFKTPRIDSDAHRNLQIARAARFGKEITSEIEEKMKKDRNSAKGK